MGKAAFDKIAGGLHEAAEIAKRDAEITRLREDLDRVTGERDKARFHPLGDNHHNAWACPHCNPEGLTLDDHRRSFMHMRARAEAAEAALAKRDEEVARLRNAVRVSIPAIEKYVTSIGYRDGLVAGLQHALGEQYDDAPAVVQYVVKEPTNAE